MYIDAYLRIFMVIIYKYSEFGYHLNLENTIYISHIQSNLLHRFMYHTRESNILVQLQLLIC